MANNAPVRGAENLLLNCAQAQPGQRLLIALESPDYGYFDAGAAQAVKRAAQHLGLETDEIEVGFNPDHPHLTQELLDKFTAADIVVFLARLGDQLRFSEMPQGKTIVVSFALNEHLFGSGFATGHHAAFYQIYRAVNAQLASAKTVRLTCPAGTDIQGTPHMVTGGDTTVRRFPLSVFTPVPAHSFSGRVALSSGFLTGTGSRYYDDYTIEFDGPVFAHMTNGRITGFTGAAHDVAKANAQYDRVAAMFDIDRNHVHSWHAGIHPGCGYPWDLRENYERWGGAAFGNPRILHFHTCGAYAPGEISWNVIDPSIEIDGALIWDEGTFHADRLPGGAEILARYPCAAALFANPDPEIGLRPRTPPAQPPARQAELHA